MNTGINALNTKELLILVNGYEKENKIIISEFFGTDTNCTTIVAADNNFEKLMEKLLLDKGNSFKGYKFFQMVEGIPTVLLT